MTQPPPGNYPPPPPAGGGGFPPQQPAGAAPSSNLVLGILTTIFCCLPFGVVSIVKAAQVNGLWAQGRYAEAQASSAAAKKWAIWSVVAWVIFVVIYGILIALGAVSMDFDTSSSY
ncbi:CD225/dispanin family protein [Mycobacterium sp. 236(2023)]|uniref:CD225/dispanin family protein n=1 Tax=Mycobacterium sp. 236(2023) TaxID=3038163 RepID=UPI002414EBD6|nr:CD225/dispanin family protein [Mycobacterium sp. 236(2023)]MDG4665967.1 CD225/dispanin family protein [Mycobacterium sp. 236(2023)]